MTGPSPAGIPDDQHEHVPVPINTEDGPRSGCAVCGCELPGPAPASTPQAAGTGAAERPLAERRRLADIRHRAEQTYAGGQFIHDTARDADVRVLLAEDRLTAERDAERAER